MNVIHWLFWPSLIALMYFGGGWLIATFWEAGAMAAVALGDMAPKSPTTLTHEVIRRELVRLLSDETRESLGSVDIGANFRTAFQFKDGREVVLGDFYFRDRFITTELHPTAFSLSIDEFSARYVQPAALALANFPRDGC